MMPRTNIRRRHRQSMDEATVNDYGLAVALFRERHWVPAWVLLLVHLATVCFIALVGSVTLIRAVASEGFTGPTATNFLLISNGLGLLLVLFVLLNNYRRVVRLEPSRLCIGWRELKLRNIVGWERVEGGRAREFRRELLKPMGRSAISIGMWAASGGVSNMFCPPWMRTALVIEVAGRIGPDYVLVGTRRPDEFQVALAAAVEDVRRRRAQ